jgi:type IV pilus assembly protein PilE
MMLPVVLMPPRASRSAPHRPSHSAALRATPRSRRRRMRGLTLTELLVVLLILAVLASLAYPGYASHITRTRRMEGKVALIEAMQRQAWQHSLHHTYTAFSSTAPVPGLPWWSGAAPAGSAYELEALACPDSTLRDCVLLRAHPGTARVDPRFVDPACGVLSLSSTGEQGASGPGPRCWP